MCHVAPLPHRTGISGANSHPHPAVVVVVVGALLIGCTQGPFGHAPSNTLEITNNTSGVVQVSWPIGAPPGTEDGDCVVPAHGVASCGFGDPIDAAFVIDGRTVEQTITSPVTGATIHVVISTNGTVAIASVTTPGP
jgi:hypothetical protein